MLTRIMRERCNLTCTGVAICKAFRVTMAPVVVSGIGNRELVLCKEFGGLQVQVQSTHRSVTLPSRCQTRVTALHHENLQAALEVVQRACQLCLSVRSAMKQGEEGSVNKLDNTPVTVADFGVQALVSLELSRLYPHIPLVGEENADQLRTNIPLVEAIVETLTPFLSRKLDCETVLDAIDRGAQTLNDQPCYWVLDPIDGTRGFLRGGKALYVVGLALVQDGKPVLGVMGCPNVAIRDSDQRGLVMAASLGGGCWVKPLTDDVNLVKSEVVKGIADPWFCTSDHEVWEKTLLARAIAEGKKLEEQEMHVMKLCCGSLCKYFALALGGVSAFLLPAAPETRLKVWDHASGVVCVSEAGGRVSDLDGRDLQTLLGSGNEFFTVEGGGIFASNTALHDLLFTDIRDQEKKLHREP